MRQHRLMQRRLNPAATSAPAEKETALAPMPGAAAAPRMPFADLSVLPPDRSGSARARPGDPNGLPGRLRSGVEALSGVSMDGVRVRYNSPHPERLGALAFARGREIHLAPGEERQLPHEAWHLVQQARGRVRPTGLAPGRVALNDDPLLEREADAMGARAASGVTPAPVPQAAPAASHAAMPVQRQTPWWKKALVGAGMVGGAAAGIAGAVMASPLLGLGGAAVALGSTYAAYREHQKSKIKLSIPADRHTRAAMHEIMGADPNIKFGKDRIESRYDAQQMMEQYGDPGWQAPLSNMMEEGHGARPLPPHASLRRAIDASFSPPGVFERSESATADRVNRARDQVQNFDYDAHDLRRDANVITDDRNALHNAPNPATAMTNILARHEGVTFGEGHGNSVTKQFLHAQLGTMAASGVNTLYMEHFRDDHQAHVDKYLASGVMPPELDRYVQRQDNHHNAGQPRLRNILGGARLHNMRVRGIDSQTAATPDGANGGGGPIREAAMNNVAQEVITGDRAARAGGKYAILTGAAHNNTQPTTPYGIGQGFARGAMGLSQLLEIPALTIDANNNPRLDEEDRNNR